MPCLVIINKDGKNLEFLNYSVINNINRDKINGWKNIVNIINYKNNKFKKYDLGDGGFIYGHRHILFYVDYFGKSPNYGKENWYCGICGKTNNYNVTNFYCILCGHDVCDDCYEKKKILIITIYIYINEINI